MKKLTAVFLCLYILLSFSGFKADASVTNDLSRYNLSTLNLVKNTVLANQTDTDSFEYEYVVNGSDVMLLGTRTESDGSVTKDWIIPFVVDTNGYAQNAFSYMQSLRDNIGTISPMNSYLSEVRDGITLRVRGSYYSAYSYLMGKNYFRPTTLSAYYSTSNSAVDAGYLYAAYYTIGDLYTISSNTLIKSDYSKTGTINQSSPVNGRAYNTSMGYSSTQGLFCFNVYEDPTHGGSVYGELEYTYNGSYRILKFDGAKTVFTV